MDGAYRERWLSLRNVHARWSSTWVHWAVRSRTTALNIGTYKIIMTDKLTLLSKMALELRVENCARVPDKDYPFSPSHAHNERSQALS